MAHQKVSYQVCYQWLFMGWMIFHVLETKPRVLRLDGTHFNIHDSKFRRRFSINYDLNFRLQKSLKEAHGWYRSLLLLFMVLFVISFHYKLKSQLDILSSKSCCPMAERKIIKLGKTWGLVNDFLGELLLELYFRGFFDLYEGIIFLKA